MDHIELDGMRLDVIVGVLDWERTRTQPVELSVALELDLSASGASGALERSVDYAMVLEQVALIASEGRFRLLESLGLAILGAVLTAPHPAEGRSAVTRAEVRMAKPEVLGGRACPAVRMAREAGFFWTAPGVALGDATRYALVELPEGGAWRVVLPGGARLELPDGVAALVLGGAVEGELGRDGAATVGATSAAVLLCVGVWS